MNNPEPLRAPQVYTRDYAPAEPPPPRRRVRWLLWLAVLFLALLLTPPAVVLALRWLPVPTSAFMLQSPVKPVQYQWVPAAQVPDTLRQAVVASEDQKFYTHNGFDFEAIAKALEHNEKSKRKRGASTISQQVAKNLFLWPSRSYLRKGLEVTFTVLIELCWSKERILEVYLNIAEFGPGVYGVEAAARRFFDKPSSELTPQEAARLAAVLPNPRKWSAERPGPYVQARIDWILVQIGYRPRFQLFPPTEEPISPEPVPEEPQLEPEEPEFEEGAPPESTPEAPVEGEAPATEPAPGAETEPSPETEAPATETPPPDEAPPPP
jgi:monofunctional biosynthetic peptidoglycan transglycosylase